MGVASLLLLLLLLDCGLYVLGDLRICGLDWLHTRKRKARETHRLRWGGPWKRAAEKPATTNARKNFT